jgi:hypothetical protein
MDIKNKTLYSILNTQYPIPTMRKIFFAVFIFLFSFANAQVQFLRYDSVPVTVNAQSLLYPWAGGINFAQFSDIDLNQDGIMDLFVFDRTGNKITTYLNGGTPNQNDYTLAPQYRTKFPKLHDWAILRDYNCDGKMDIFTSYSGSTPGISVYENISTIANGLQFQLVANPIVSAYTPNSCASCLQTLFVTTVDIPAIRDVDHDGDLDVLTYDGAGVAVEFHRNMSMENFGVCDSIVYKLETGCWGEFNENTLNANLTLNITCPPPSLTPPDNSENSVHHNLHNGSCLECINTDGDNDMDILIGDISFNRITYGRNGGDSSYAHMDLTDPYFPNYNDTLSMFLFNCGYHVDIDNDGKKDLLICPNASNSSENTKSVWYYHNVGADDSVVVSFIKNNFLQSDMIEVGEGAFPRFFDYDNDGDQDLFIANYGYYASTGSYPSEIALFKNIGTTGFPNYKLQTTDFVNLYATSSNIVCPVPAFGDMDGDGDEDMIIGDATGKLHYYRKDPGPADNFVLVASNYAGIDVGNYATPQIVDVDRDGKLDLLIGEQSGNINYYRNIGTTSVANFSFVTPLFGNVIINFPGFTTGYSVPYLWDDGGNYVLLVGSERGWLNRYDNIDGNLAGTFTRTDSMYVSTVEGLRIAPWMADINGDTIPDLVIGNYSGGVSLFMGSLLNGLDEFGVESMEFGVYPNPTEGNFTLTNSLSQKDFPAQLMIYNLEGQIVLKKEISSSSQQIDVSDFSAGVYVCTLQSKTGMISHRKLVIKK